MWPEKCVESGWIPFRFLRYIEGSQSVFADGAGDGSVHIPNNNRCILIIVLIVVFIIITATVNPYQFHC